MEKTSNIYGLMILDNIGGMNSKMSMINQYLYSMINIENDYPVLAAVFDEILKTETKHLKLLMQLALKLDSDPRLWSCLNDQCSYWSPSYINYPTQIKIIFNTLIKQNILATRKYQQQIKQVTNKEIQELLMQIINDEAKHLNILEKWETKLVRKSN
ncbi:ferritin family protein [uncultured Thomasclavelia sp.]|uniref:ferritin family protein n=1 Tax=uncultured Thomasclavelia sp. TaxID=3025759 RepID=UPI0026331927|nr:ferritin family protein [uncultured Thomasclavelia sp.]